MASNNIESGLHALRRAVRFLTCSLHKAGRKRREGNPVKREYSNRLTASLSYFGAVVAGQAMAFLVLPFVTRALSPSTYGTYSLTLAVMSLAAMIATSWMRNVALTIYYESADRGATKGFFIGLALMQLVSFTLVSAAVIGFLLIWSGDSYDFRTLLSAWLMFVVSDLAILATTLLRAERRATAFGIVEGGGAFLRFLLTVIGLAVGLRSAALLFDAAALGYAIAAVVAVRLLWPRLSGPPRPDRVVIRTVLRHGPGALPFSIAEWVERLSDRLVIEAYLGTAAVGIYSIGYTLGERTIGAVMNAVFLMAWPNILEANERHGASATKLAIREAQAMYAWFTVGPTAFLVAYGAEVLRWFAGANFAESGQIVPIVAASMWVGGLTTYWNRHMEMRRNYKTLSAIRIVGAALNLALNILLVPMYGILGAAWATMVARAVNGAAFFVTRDREVTEIPLRPLVAAGGLSTVLWLSLYLSGLATVWQCIFFVLVYAVVALFQLRKISRSAGPN